jgi:hypothetical protein
MDILGKIKTFLEKLQNLPDNKKKIILWTIVVILGLIMGFFWVKGAINSFAKFGESVQNIKLPEINMSGMPQLDILQTTSPNNQPLTK